MRSARAQRLLRLLSRTTSAGRFVPEIDGLRFVAIASVVLFHLYVFISKKLGLQTADSWLALVMSKGAIGVQLFFVISGFIISLPFAQAERGGRALPTLSAYYRRRLTRLEPPYILNLVVISTLLLLVGKQSWRELSPHFLASVSYSHNLIYGQASTINGVAWSLEVECQFYLVAPLLAQVFSMRSVRSRRLLLVSAIVLSSWASAYVLPQTARWHLALPHQLSYFLCGFLLSDLFALELASRTIEAAGSVSQGASEGAAATPEVRRTYGWDVAGALSWLLILSLLLGPSPLRILLPVPITLACCAAFRGRVGGKLFRTPLLYTIGGMCYTIYLYHEFVISLFGGVFVRVPGLSTLPVALSLGSVSLMIAPVLLFSCAGLFVLTEKPFMYSTWPAGVHAWWSALASRRQTGPVLPR